MLPNDPLVRYGHAVRTIDEACDTAARERLANAVRDRRVGRWSSIVHRVVSTMARFRRPAGHARPPIARQGDAWPS